MKSSLQPLLQGLQVARKRKGLTQRELGEQVGIPQSHVSRIESGGVDVQASNLIELARALDLELVLVPRRLLPTLGALKRGTESQSVPPAPRLRRMLSRLELKAGKVLQHLSGTDRQTLQDFVKLLEATRHVQMDVDSTDMFVKLGKAAEHHLDTLVELTSKAERRPATTNLAEHLNALKVLRNASIHAQSAAPIAQVPAYRLTEDGGDT